MELLSLEIQTSVVLVPKYTEVGKSESVYTYRIKTFPNGFRGTRLNSGKHCVHYNR